MEFIDGTYRAIRVLFNTPIYEQTMQTCWHTGSYKSQIVLLTELLRLQEEKQLFSEMTADDMTEMLVEQCKHSLRVKIWEFQLDDFDNTDARPLLKLVWEVNTSMKMRDIEFEARRLLNSPESVLPHLQHTKIISQAEKFAKSLREKQREAPSPKLLGPRDVVMEVVPRVLHGFWSPTSCAFFSMPSKQLSKMAVSVTKAVEDRVSAALSTMLPQVTFTRSTRCNMILSVQEKVRELYPEDDRAKLISCCAAEMLNTVADVAAEEICELFQTQTKESANMNIRTDPAGGAEANICLQCVKEEHTKLEGETESADLTPFPTPLTSSDDSPANIDLYEEDEPLLNQESDSAPLIPSSDPPADTTISRQPKLNPEPESAVAVPGTEMNGFSCSLSWLQKNVCCGFLSEDDTK